VPPPGLNPSSTMLGGNHLWVRGRQGGASQGGASQGEHRRGEHRKGEHRRGSIAGGSIAGGLRWAAAPGMPGRVRTCCGLWYAREGQGMWILGDGQGSVPKSANLMPGTSSPHLHSKMAHGWRYRSSAVQLPSWHLRRTLAGPTEWTEAVWDRCFVSPHEDASADRGSAGATPREGEGASAKGGRGAGRNSGSTRGQP